MKQREQKLWRQTIHIEKNYIFCNEQKKPLKAPKRL
ncbi:hypothetical protein EMIT0196MI5_80160 [Pseudomonas sp. IT-196MI5]